jgi:glycoprotein-N-acetylgalactosamine 3-beta-galactosyltransferase
MENLKTFLSDKCANSMNMYGKIFRYFKGPKYEKIFNGENIDKGFIHSGSGLLISRDGLKKFVEAFNNPKFCPLHFAQLSDQELSNCLRKINVVAAESRDQENKERFITDTFEDLFSWPSQDQYRYSFNPVRLVSICNN